MKQPPHTDFPTLVTEALDLRQIVAADMETMMDISFYDGLPATTVEEAWEMQQRINRDYEAGNSIHWGIVQTNSESVGIVGTCGYYRGFADETGEVGFVLKPQFQRRGLMKRALKLVVDFGFDAMGLARITAFTSASNIPARTVLSRVGFTGVATPTENEFLEYQISSSDRDK